MTGVPAGPPGRAGPSGAGGSGADPAPDTTVRLGSSVVPDTTVRLGSGVVPDAGAEPDSSAAPDAGARGDGTRPRDVHLALPYASDHEFAAGVESFVSACVSVGGRALVAVPEPRLTLLRERLAGLDCADDAVRFADMTELGRNPGRIIGAVHQFAGESRDLPVVFVTEPIWPGRSADEITEAFAHERLLNRPIAGVHAILCPYDADLGAAVLHTMRCIHPGTQERPEDGDDGPAFELTPPPEDAATVAFRDPKELAQLRHQVARQAEQVGLTGDRLGDFLLAMNEVATNTLEHAGPPGVLTIWSDSDAVVCQVTDGGRITDPFVGRVPPPLAARRGRGLYLVHQLCDLVQLRSGPSGTAIRMHMRRSAAVPA